MVKPSEVMMNDAETGSASRVSGDTVTNRLVRSVLDIQSPPVVAVKLTELFFTEFSLDDLVQIIEVDPAITGRLLRVCNSAYFRGRSEVASLQDAVSVLGFGEIVKLVWNFSVGNTLRQPLEAYGMCGDELWIHSVNTAFAAQELTRRCPFPPQNEQVAFTAGLLHDLGKIALNGEFDDGGLLKWVSVSERSIVDFERTHSVMDHAELGGEIMRRWKLPQAIVEAVEGHHRPSEDELALSSVIHLADCAAHNLGASYGFYSLTNPVSCSTMERLQLSPEDWDDAILATLMKADEVKQFIGV